MYLLHVSACVSAMFLTVLKSGTVRVGLFSFLSVLLFLSLWKCHYLASSAAPHIHGLGTAFS